MAVSSTDAPPHSSTPSPWSAGVIAAGAVLAGLVLGRSGRVGLVAGVAAAASVRLMTSARRTNCCSHGPIIVDSDLNLSDAPHHNHMPVEEPPSEEKDWVDSDAVVFEHLVPAPDTIAELLKPKGLPLLDDDGVEIQEPPPFPYGPVIWAPGRALLSRSEGSFETVWFGLHESAPITAFDETASPKEMQKGISMAEPEAAGADSSFSLPPATVPASPVTLMPRLLSKSALPRPRQQGELPRQILKVASDSRSSMQAPAKATLPSTAAPRLVPTAPHAQANQGSHGAWLVFIAVLALGAVLAAAALRQDQPLEASEQHEIPRLTPSTLPKKI